jgi:hypothetical protein
LAPEPRFPNTSLEALARVLGDAMTGTQLTQLLAQARVEDVSDESTKWRRIYSNLGLFDTTPWLSERPGRGRSVAFTLPIVETMGKGALPPLGQPVLD